MRKPLIASIVLTLLAAGVALLQTQTPPERPLASLIPGGALVYVEARDLNKLLREWDQSEVKRAWLPSHNFSVFSNSNLYQKLSGVFAEYSAAATFTADLGAVTGMAGGHSALALYEFREVEFLAVSRIADQQLMRSRIWAVRDKFEERRAGTRTFYLRREPASRRTVAFAFVDGYFLLATRDDLVARALGLLGRANEPSIAADRWYRDPVAQRPAAGEVRMVLNLESMVRSTYFRSYWIQRNASAIGRLRAGVADFDRTPAQYVERRLFLRANPAPAEPAAARPSDPLAQLATPLASSSQAGLVRGWANPDPAELTALIEAKLLAPKTHRARFDPYAPYEAPMDDRAGGGGENDLETRIDEPELDLASAGKVNTSPLARLLAAARPEAVLHSQQSAAVPGASWISTPSLIAIAAPVDWDPAPIREALAASVESYLTTSRLGVGWTSRNVPRDAGGGGTIDQMNGLVKLYVAVRGRLLYLANDEALLAGVLLSPNQRTAPNLAGASYFATLNLGAERAHYGQLMTALDSAHENQRYGLAMFVPGGAATPPFFSANLASLSGIFGFVDRVEVRQTDAADSLAEEVTYRIR